MIWKEDVIEVFDLSALLDHPLNVLIRVFLMTSGILSNTLLRVYTPLLTFSCAQIVTLIPFFYSPSLAFSCYGLINSCLLPLFFSKIPLMWWSPKEEDKEE